MNFKKLSRMGSRRFRFKWWYILLPLVVIIIIYMAGPVFKLFRSLFTGLNVAGSKALTAVGLDPVANEVMTQAVTGGVSNPWSPQYAISRNPDMLIPGGAYNATVYDVDLDEIHKAQSFMGGIKMDRYVALFNNYQTKSEFSAMCHRWEVKEGTNLAQWMQSGWLFGLVSAMGGADFKRLDDIIKALPE